MNNKNIAIVGGGSMGPVQLIYISKYAQEHNLDLTGFNFHLIDPNGFCNGGIAYGQCSDTHILNTLRNEMSPWEPGKFNIYQVSKGREDNKYKFDLRSDFKEFLTQEFNIARDILKSLGADITEHLHKAFLRINDDKFNIVNETESIISEDLTNLPVENIILTVGYGPNNNFKDLWEHRGNGYVHNLYSVDEFNNAMSNDKEKLKVAVIGSAAAFYDFLNSLKSFNKDLELHIFSYGATSGLEIRQVENEHLLKDLELKYLKAINESSTVEDIETAIENEFKYSRDIQAGPDTWPAFRMMGIMSSVLNKVDSQVSKDFRNRDLFKKVRRLGGPTTRVSAELLHKYNHNFIPFDISTDYVVRLEDGTFNIEVNGDTYNVDVIVNASGHGRHNSAIMEDLKNQGLAVINPKIDVLAVDDTGYRLLGSGIASIGPATHFGTDGIETFSKHSANLANELVQMIKKSQS